jgi:TonB family protein
VPAVTAIFILAALAPFAAAGLQPPSTVARGVAEREAGLKKKIAAAPADPQAYFDLADLQRDFGAVADAEATLLKARQALPTNKNVLVKLASFYSLGQFEKAIDMLHFAAELDPADPDTECMIAAFYQDKVYIDKSLGPAQRATYVREGIAAADRALVLKPDFMEALVYKGILFKAGAELATDPAEKNQRIAEADALLRRATELRAKRSAAQDPQSSSTAASPPPRPPESPAPVTVGGDIKAPARILNVPPVYPEEAAASRIQGAVVIEATISAAGRISSTMVLRSVPLLDQAALDAVRQWVYEPTYVKG